MKVGTADKARLQLSEKHVCFPQIHAVAIETSYR